MIFCPIDNNIPGRPWKFILAQNVLNSHVYAMNLAEYSSYSPRINYILDNGAYEDACVDFEDLFNVAAMILPRVVFCPDVIHDANATEYISRQFALIYKDELLEQGCALGFVLQGSNPEQVRQQYVKARDFGYTWIGFSRAMNDNGRYHLRVSAARLIQRKGDWDPYLVHHALGTCPGTWEEKADELQQLAALGFHSCDSHSPAKLGKLEEAFRICQNV